MTIADMLPCRSPRDYPEDFPHENGAYQNICLDCARLFYGHKRRVICKTCRGAVATGEGGAELSDCLIVRLSDGLPGKGGG